MPILQSSVRQSLVPVAAVPGPQRLQELPSEEDGVAAERHHSGRGLQLEPGLEPLVVLQHVRCSPPAAAVRQPPTPDPAQRPGGSGRLAGSVVAFISWTPHCTIPAPVRAEAVVDHAQQFGMEDVLGVGDADPLVRDLQVVQHPDRRGSSRSACCARRCPPGTGRPAPAPGTAGRPRARSARCHVVVVVDDRDHPVTRVVQVGQSAQRRPGDRLLVPHRHQDRARQLRRARRAVPVRIVVLRPPPLVELEHQRGARDDDHERRRSPPGTRRADQRERSAPRRPGERDHHPARVGRAGPAVGRDGQAGLRPERPVAVEAEVDRRADGKQRQYAGEVPIPAPAPGKRPPTAAGSRAGPPGTAASVTAAAVPEPSAPVPPGQQRVAGEVELECDTACTVLATAGIRPHASRATSNSCPATPTDMPTRTNRTASRWSERTVGMRDSVFLLRLRTVIGHASATTADRGGAHARAGRGIVAAGLRPGGVDRDARHRLLPIGAPAMTARR